jgi:hypothetical protein
MTACPAGWRLPNIRELRNIFDTWETTGAPAGITQMTKDDYWSDTVYSQYAANYVAFFGGYTGGKNQSQDAYVRCVRSI